MAVTSHQVKGNNDDPSLQHSETITVLAWLSSFMISQEQFLNEEDKTVVLSNCHLGSQGLVCSKCTVSIFPICSWRSVRGVRARMSSGECQLQVEMPQRKHLRRRCLPGEPSTAEGVYEAILLTHTSICQVHRDAADIQGHFM